MHILLFAGIDGAVFAVFAYLALWLWRFLTPHLHPDAPTPVPHGWRHRHHLRHGRRHRHAHRNPYI